MSEYINLIGTHIGEILVIVVGVGMFVALMVIAGMAGFVDGIFGRR